MEIVPVGDCALPAEDRPGAARLIDELLFVHFRHDVPVSTVFLLVLPLSTVAGVTLKIVVVFLFASVLSFPLVVALLALVALSFLAFASIDSIDIRSLPVGDDWLGCHDLLATE